MKTMAPGLRRIALTAHVTCSVGWLGAVAAFLALAIAGLAGQDAQMVRAAYLSMELTAWYVIVPFAFCSLLTGLVMSLGTPWGLIRHFWVLFKFFITVVATIVLLGYLQTLTHLAGAAAETGLSGAERASPVIHAGAALVALLVANVLAVFKPRGMTRYGQRTLREQRAVSQS
jgi:hypothetical protein